MIRTRVGSTKYLIRQFNGLCLRQPVCLARAYSSVEQPPQQPASVANATEEEKKEEVPWYLRTTQTYTKLNPKLSEPIPAMPANAPPELEPIVTEMVRELGFTDIVMIDLRNREEVSVFGPNAILILATGNTDRHIGRGTASLVTFLKHTYNVIPKQEGIQTSGFLRVQQRRLKKKAKKMANSDETFDYDAEVGKFINNWVVLDTKIDGLMIHFMTPEKRKELDLEFVWAEDRKKLIEERRKKRAEEQSQSSEDSPFNRPNGAVRGFHTFRRTLTTGNIQTSSNQEFIDMANTSEFEMAVKNGDYKTAVSLGSPETSENVLRAHINHLRTLKTPLTQDSEVVRSFISSFPLDPTPRAYDIRLQFFLQAHTLSPKNFTTTHLKNLLITQQASGYPVSMAAIIEVIKQIAFTSEFTSLTSKQARVKKMKLIHAIQRDVLRSQGLHMPPEMYRLMFLVLINPPRFSMEHAIQDPTPDIRSDYPNCMTTPALTLHEFLIRQNLFNYKFISLSFAALASDGLWDRYFKLWWLVNKNVDFSNNQLIKGVAALVVKSGSEMAISRYFETVLTKIAIEYPEVFDDEMKNVIMEGLKVVDPSDQSWKYVRELL